MRCDEATLLLGSYVLGGLDPAEAADMDRHLATCAGCRRALARLQGLPDLLETMGPEEALEPGPPPDLERAVLAGFAARSPAGPPAPDRARDRRRRWPLAAAGALAGAAATVAVLALAGAFSTPQPDATRLTLVSASGAPRASAQVRLVATSAGTEIDLDADLPRLRAGEVYELWFAGDDGIVSAGTFTVDSHGWAEVQMTTAARAGPYARLGITREPDGHDPARNGEMVVSAPLQG
jgi:anti-sigma-K factor RskA